MTCFTHHYCEYTSRMMTESSLEGETTRFPNSGEPAASGQQIKSYAIVVATQMPNSRYSGQRGTNHGCRMKK